MEVENRKSNTLIPIIIDRVKPGTTIISDCWKAYDCLSKEDFHHLKVNHSIEFVRYSDDLKIHTNTIEGTWRHCKGAMPVTGTNHEYFKDYLDTFMYNRLISKSSNKLDVFLADIAQSQLQNVNMSVDSDE